MSFGIARYQCRGCGNEWEQAPTQVQCKNCGCIYCDWLNYEEWAKEYQKHQEQKGNV